MKTKNDIFREVSKTHINGIKAGKSKKAKSWLESKALCSETTGAGYSAGQLHHRSETQWLNELLSIGYLKIAQANTNNGKPGYNTFAKEAIVFPLLDEQGEIVNFYSIQLEPKGHPVEYLNRNGVYPCYPNAMTHRLFLTNNILDSASLLECKVLSNRDAIIALKDGRLTQAEIHAVNQLKHLNELCVIGDIIESTIDLLKSSYNNFSIRHIILPEKSLNQMLIKYHSAAIRTYITDELKSTICLPQCEYHEQLEQISIGKLVYKTERGAYFVMGDLPTDLGSMKITIHFEEIETKRKHRNKFDLYDRAQLLNFAISVAERLNVNREQIESDLIRLTDLVENHRENELNANDIQNKKRNQNLLPPDKEKDAIAFLSQPNLISRIDELIGESGIVGEYANRKMLYIIASTYKMGNQLHGLIQATSGSGKSHLINSIAALMPQEDVLNMTRVTSKSLYHYQKDDLINKLILIQDLDGLDEQAQFAFRELQSANKLSSSTTYKDRFGNLKSGVKLVEGRFASLVATTHSEVYFDNMSRSIVLGIDESAEQTYRIINYQNRCISGQIDQVKEMQAKELLQNCMRTLKPYSIVNLYAEKLLLPLEAKTLRRLNSHYHAFVSQITLLNQFQRKTDNQGRLITTIEDLEVACEILFNAIILKLDELDSSTRQFFDGLKAYMSKECRGEHSTFTAREIRQAFNLSKTHTFRFLEGLLQLEYLVIEEGSANRGFKYKITYWDDFTKTREKVKSSLMLQLKQLKK